MPFATAWSTLMRGGCPVCRREQEAGFFEQIGGMLDHSFHTAQGWCGWIGGVALGSTRVSELGLALVGLILGNIIGALLHSWCGGIGKPYAIRPNDGGDFALLAYLAFILWRGSQPSGWMAGGIVAPFVLLFLAGKIVGLEEAKEASQVMVRDRRGNNLPRSVQNDPAHLAG